MSNQNLNEEVIASQSTDQNDQSDMESFTPDYSDGNDGNLKPDLCENLDLLEGLEYRTNKEKFQAKLVNGNIQFRYKIKSQKQWTPDINIKTKLNSDYIQEYNIEKNNKKYKDFDSIVLKKYMKILHNYANTVNKKNSKSNCDWEQFGGYETFRDYYFKHSDNSHWKYRYGIIHSSTCIGEAKLSWCDHCHVDLNHYEDRCVIQVVDLQQPDSFPVYVQQQYDSYDFNQLIKGFQNFDEFKECEILGSEEQIDQEEIEKVENCLCGELIQICEKARNIAELTMEVLKTIKQKNINLYLYLKTLRKDKMFEFLQFCIPNLYEITKDGISNESNDLEITIDEELKELKEIQKQIPICSSDNEGEDDEVEDDNLENLKETNKQLKQQLNALLYLSNKKRFVKDLYYKEKQALKQFFKIEEDSIQRKKQH